MSKANTILKRPRTPCPDVRKSLMSTDARRSIEDLIYKYHNDGATSLSDNDTKLFPDIQERALNAQIAIAALDKAIYKKAMELGIPDEHYWDYVG